MREPVRGGQFSDEQKMNAGAIIAVGRELGMSDQTIAAALATAFMESGLRNLDYGDRDSLGLFQQRPSQGWGTPEQIRDVRHAATKFFEAYSRAEGDTVLERIANTQRPAEEHRGKYANWFDDAQLMFQQVAGTDPPDLGGGPTVTAPATQQAQADGGTVVVATGASPTETRPDITADSPPDQIEDYIRTYYADVAPFLNDPAIKMILYAAAIDDWDERRLDAAIEQTAYWKSHGPTSRAFDALLAEDPEGAEELIQRVTGTVSDAFARQGVDLASGEAGELAKQAIRDGAFTLQGGLADQNYLNDLIVSRLPEELTEGESALNANTIITLARDFGLPLARSTADEWARDILAGRKTNESIRASLLAMAKNDWKNDADVLTSLENGFTVRQAFARHAAAIAEVLELDPSMVDVVNDAKYAEVLQVFDPAIKGKRAMTVGEAKQWAWSQPAARNTTGWRERKASVGSAVLGILEAA